MAARKRPAAEAPAEAVHRILDVLYAARTRDERWNTVATMLGAMLWEGERGALDFEAQQRRHREQRSAGAVPPGEARAKVFVLAERRPR